MTTTTTLATFISRQLDAEEAGAMEAGSMSHNGGPYEPAHWYADADGHGWSIGWGTSEDDDQGVCVTCNDSGGNELSEDHARHMAKWNPARIVAEVAAKREIVALHRWCEDEPTITSVAWEASIGHPPLACSALRERTGLA